jgi:hypothetical protein
LFKELEQGAQLIWTQPRRVHQGLTLSIKPTGKRSVNPLDERSHEANGMEFTSALLNLVVQRMVVELSRSDVNFVQLTSTKLNFAKHRSHQLTRSALRRAGHKLDYPLHPSGV